MGVSEPNLAGAIDTSMNLTDSSVSALVLPIWGDIGVHVQFRRWPFSLSRGLSCLPTRRM